jgi:Rrf2 family protein
VKYLEQIMHLLKKFGYVESRRGTQGGYLLRIPPEEINIGEVIRHLEGPLSPMGCASITSYEACSLEVGCLLKPLWVLVRDKIAEVLDQTTLEDLLQRKIKPHAGGSIC